MGILEEIANPKTNSFLESLKVFEGIETNRISRRLMEMQAGLTLQKMQAAKQAQQQQAQGYQTIADFMRPQTGGNTTPREQSNVVPEAERKNLIVQNPNQPTYMMQGAQNAPSPAETTIPGETPAQPTFMQQSAEGQPSPQTDIIPQVSAALASIPTEELDKTDWMELGAQLAKNPAMQAQSQFFLNLGMRSEKSLAQQTKEEKKDAEILFTNYGNAMREVAQLEDKNEGAKARELYNQLIVDIKNDPRLTDNPKVRQFFDAVSEYRPGLGKFIWTTTNYGKKLRDQYAEKASDWTKVIDSSGKEWLINKVTDERKPIGESWVKAKEQAIKERFDIRGEKADERTAMMRDKMDLTAKKFNISSTDQIIKFKTQEEKDLKEMKGSLERALTLAQTTNDFDLVDKLLQQSMSKWENTSVRAVAELNKFDPTSIGDLEQRISNSVSEFFKGEMTAETRQKIIRTAQQMYDKLIVPALAVSDNYWRTIASKRNLDPDEVALFTNKEEVGQALKDGVINYEQAVRILSQPRFKMVQGQ